MASAKVLGGSSRDGEYATKKLKSTPVDYHGFDPAEIKQGFKVAGKGREGVGKPNANAMTSNKGK